LWWKTTWWWVIFPGLLMHIQYFLAWSVIYPRKPVHMFTFIQKVFMGLDNSKPLKPCLHALKIICYWKSSSSYVIQMSGCHECYLGILSVMLWHWYFVESTLNWILGRHICISLPLFLMLALFSSLRTNL